MNLFPKLLAAILLFGFAVVAQAAGTGLTGDYYTSTNFNGTRSTRVDATVDFDWGTNAPGFGGLGSNNFSIRWSGQIEPRYSETYTFYVTADEGATLWVNDRLIVSRLFYAAPAQIGGQITLQANERVNIRLEYLEKTNAASVRLEWTSASQAREVVPQIQLYPTSLTAERGSILREHWANLPGTAVTNLTTFTNYPAKPDGREMFLSFECLQPNWTTNVGTRLSGYVMPRTNGVYTFAVAASDTAELWLSTDTNPANNQLIAFVTNATAFRDWSNQVSQVSTGRTLGAWQKYYIELRHKAGANSNHYSVAWQPPGAAQFSVIGADYLIPAGLNNTLPAQTNIFNTLSASHPRLLATAERFEWLKQQVATNPAGQPALWYASIYKSATNLYTAATMVYAQDVRGTILDQSRTVKERMYLLGLAWKISGETNLAERAWTELNAAGNFPDWHPAHFLDTAEMTHGFAIAYDWFYEYWSAGRKNFILTNITTKGLAAGMTEMATASWAKSTGNNWNMVCNGGLTLGALAVGMDAETEAERMLTNTINSQAPVMQHFTTDNGLWYEGPGYWDYTCDYNFRMLAGLQSALGTDFGLSTTNGLNNAGLFAILQTSANKRNFNYADAGGAGVSGGPQMFWWARRFDMPAYARYERTNGSADAMSVLLWDGRGGDPVSENIGSDILFLGPSSTPFNPQHVGVFRSSWGDTSETFLTFKGGQMGADHGDLDAGTFVIEALGQRWAMELGSDDYALPGYFSSNPSPGTDRWDYYRMRAEGQNTVVINPGSGPDTRLGPVAPVITFQSKTGVRALSVMDLTPVETNITRAWRGFQLFGPQRQQVLIQDEITSTNANVWWFMHYQCSSTQVAFSANSNSVTMTQGTNRLWGKILSGGGAFQIMDARPLPTSPDPTNQNLNTNFQKLAIHLTGVTNTTIAVWFVPLAPGQNPPMVSPALTPLAQWQIPQDDPPVALDGNFTTPENTAIDIDLTTLASDAVTPASNLVFAVTSPTNGTVTLLPDGHTARFSPAVNYYGAGQFIYSVTNAATNSATAGVWINISAATWYWDTSTAAGLQPANGTWDGATAAWSATNSGSNPLLAWPSQGNDAAFVGAGGTYAVTINSTQMVNQISTTNGTWTFTGGALNHASGPMTITANADTTLNSPLIADTDFTKLGTNRLTLGAPVSFSGNAYVPSGTLRLTNSNALPVTADVSVGSVNGTVGSLDASASQTISSLNFQSLNVATNTVSISAGGTLTVSNTANGIAFGVGNYGTTIGGITATTRVSFVRGGSLAVNAPNGSFSIEPSGTNSVGTALAVLDLSGLSTFTANVSSFTASVIGGKPNNVAGQFVLTLATNNTITATNLVLGASGYGNGTDAINLGANNILNVNSLAVVGGRKTGTMSFQSGAISNLVIRGVSGGASRADIWVGDQVNFSGLGSGGGGSTPCNGTLNFGAATVDARLDQLTLGIGASYASQTYGNATGAFIFGGYSSTVDVNSLYLGYATSNSAVATTYNSPTHSGTVSMNGGTLLVNSNFFLGYSADDDLGNTQKVAGVFNLNGGAATIASGVYLGYATNTVGTVSGTLNLSNGTFNVSGDIQSSGITATGTVNLVGAALNLNGNQIGSGSQSINFVAGSGTLANIGELNGGGPLVKTGTGTLTLSGTNSYTGVTTISAGTLLLIGDSVACTNTVTVSSNTTFGGTGTMGGNVVVSKGGKLVPGGLNNIGTLTLTNTLALNGGSLFFEMANSTGGTNDLVAVGSSLSLGATNIVFLSGGAPAGDYLLMSYASTNGTGTFVLAAAYPNASLVINPTNLVLHVGAGGGVFGLTWKGAVNGTWDTTVLNWTNGIMTTNFNAGDYVVFDDTMAKNPLVTNATPGAVVAPGSVAFNNSLTNYTINANIGGAGSLSKFGAATVALAGTNTYTGNTTVSAGTLIVTNGGAINSPAGTLNIGSDVNRSTVTLTGGGSSLTVRTLLATNVVCGGPTNSIFNFSGGTLTTSNNNGLAANILLASNANFNVSGNWNLNGGTNLIMSVATNNNQATAYVYLGNTVNNATMTINSNAVLWLPPPPLGSGVTASNALSLFVGLNAATNNLLLVNGGTLIATNNNSGTGYNSIQVGASAASTANQLIITNGGQVFSRGNGSASPVVGYVGANGSNNKLKVSVVNGAGQYSSWDLGGDRLNLGVAGTTISNNTIWIGQGGMLTNVSLLVYGYNNSVTVTNGGQIYAVGLTVGRQGLNSSAYVGGADSGGKKAMVFFPASGKNLIVGGGQGLGGSVSNPGTNCLVTIDANGLLTNASIVYVGGGGLTNDAYCVSNGIVITNGGQLFSTANSFIGGSTNCDYNFVTVGGGGGQSLWDMNNATLTLGTKTFASGVVTDKGNYLKLFNGGLLTNVSSIILGGTNSLLVFNGGTLEAGNAGTLIATNATTVNATNLVQAGGAIIDDGGLAVTIQLPLLRDTNSPNGGLTKLGSGTLTLANSNTYTGPTTISAGTLALTGGASIAASPRISVAGGATFNVSALPSTYVLGVGQTLSNSSAGAGVSGNIDCSSAPLSLAYDGTNVSFTVATGTLTLAANTVFVLNNTGPVLAPGSYKLIANSATGGGGLVAGTVPTNVTFIGASMAATSVLQIVAGELYLGVGGLSSGISYGPTTFTYNGSAQSPTITYIGSTGARTTNFVGVAPTVYGPGSKAPTNAGIYFMTNTVAADATYFGATDSTRFIINPAGTISFSATNAGLVINPAFCGLSYEKTMLTKSLFVSNNTSMINMLTQIGPAVFRIGANGVDTTCWGGLSGLTAITPAQVDAFAGFVKALPTNWQVIYGINMSVNNPTNCAAEAAYAANALGSRLLGFEIGNECDLFYRNGFRSTNYTFADFLSEWRVLAAAITNTVPGWAITNGGNGWTLTGPASAYNMNYTVPFAANTAGVASMVTHHYYRGDGQDTTNSTMTKLLALDANLPATVSNIVAAAKSANLAQGFRMDECGSFYNGGNTISSQFGAALWTLDFMFINALNGAQGVNFHGGGQNYNNYTPIADNGTNVVMARPEFYGMKLFSLASLGGSVLPATNTVGTNFNFTAYGVRQAPGVIGAVLINKETNYSVQVTINLGSNVVAASSMVLAGTALDSISGHTLGGAAINPDGSWAGGFQSTALTTNGQLTVTVPPITALWLSPITPGTNTLLANDAAGTSSFTGSTNWTDGLAPHGLANYFTSTNLLRSPAAGSGFIFGGNSLTIGPSAPGNTSFRLAFNAPGGACAINNCILAGGIIDAGASNATNVLSGTNWFVSAPGGFGLGGDNSRAIVLTNLNLGGTSALSNGVANPASGLGTIIYAGNAANFTGPIVTSFGTTLQAYSQTNLGGNPAGFNAAQFVLDNGIFQPLASLALSNANSGVTLNPGGGTFNVGSGLTLMVDNPIAGSGSLTNLGGGLLILSGTNPYTGDTTISAGEVMGLAGSSCSNSAFTVLTGATNGVQILPGGGQWVSAALTASAGSCLDFNFTNTIIGGTTAPLKVLGVFNYTNPTVIVRTATGITYGQYPLIEYAALSGTVISNVTIVPALADNLKYRIITNAVRSTLDLVILSTNNTGVLSWGAGNGCWDINASTNWQSLGLFGLTYQDGADVVFDDNASGASSILVTNAVVVSPAGIIANLTNKNYLISGNAIAGAATLVKNGPGLLLLSGANTYTGDTVISGGTVLVNGNSAASTSLVTVSGNAIFGGTGSHGGTVLVNAGGRLAPGGMGVVGALTLTNNLALNGGNVFYELANSTGGTNDFVAVGNTVYLTNANVILLSGAAPAGDYILMSYAATNGPGTIALASSYPNTSLIINPTNLVLRVGAGGAVFGLTWKGNVSGTWDASALNWTNGIMATNFSLGDNVVFDDTLANNPVVTNATPGAVVLPGAVTFNNSLTNYTINANIGGAGSLIKFGSATVALTGTNTYTGNTTINAGTLMVTNGGSINSPNATLNIGPDVNRATNTLAAGGAITVQTLLATNVVSGGVSNSVFTFAGGTLTTSNNNGLASSMLLASNVSWTMNSSWNLNGGTNIFSNVATNQNASATLSVGNGANNVQVSVNPNAVWWHAIPANSASTNVLALVLGAGNATNNVFTVNGGSVIVTNSKGDKAAITVGNAAGSTGNQVVVTNGGQVLTDCRQDGGAVAGFVGSAGNNNSLVVAGTNAAGRKSTWNMVSDRLQIGNGTGIAYSNNWVRVDQGGLITNSTIMIYCSYSYLFITNGGQFFTPGATVGRIGFNSSLMVGGTDAAGNKAALRFISGNMTIGGGSVLTSNPGTNNLVRVEAGGIITNASLVSIGGSQTTYDISCLSNSLVITNGGRVFSTGNSTIGLNTNCNNNSASIGGGAGGSLWRLNNNTITIGNHALATNNFVTLFSGGVLTNVSSVILGGVNSRFNFNGGTLAAGAGGNWLNTNSAAINAAIYVQSGGAVMDSVGFTVTNRMPLLQDTNSTGGLTKLGSGTLTLLGTNSYTGNTTVSAGILNLQQPTLATNSTVMVARGAVLNLGFSVTNLVTGLVTNGVSLPAGVYSSNTVAPFITGPGSLLVAGAVVLPTISGSATFTNFVATYGLASASQSFPVMGVNLTSDITNTAASGFEVSTNNISGYAVTAVIPNAGGSASGTVYVRLTATATAGSCNSSNIVVVASAGAASLTNVSTASGNVVNPATPVLTVIASAITYGQTLTNVSLAGSVATNGNNNALVLGGLALALTTNVPNAGITNVAVNFTPLDTTNYTLASTNVNITVTPASLLIAANGTNKLYNTTLSFSGGEYTSSGLVNGNVVTNVTLASAGATNTAPVGVYANTATNALGIGLTNYSIVYSNGQLTVESGIYSIEWTNPASIGYGTALGTNQNAASASVAGTYVYNPTNGTVLPAGTNTLHVTFTPGDTNYAATNLSATLVVTPATLVITANSTNKLYNTTLSFSGGEYTSSGLVNGNTVTNVTLASAGASPAAPVGVYAVTATNALGIGLTNYSIVYSNGQLTVEPGIYTITWTNPASIGYGTALGTNQNAASASVVGTYVYNPTNGTLLAAGTNTLHVTFTPTDTNYAATNLSATLVVTPAVLVITANTTNKVYNTTLVFSGGEFTSSGLVNGNVVTNVTLASAGASPAAPVGLYAVTATNALGSGLTNYSIVYSNGQLTVGQGAYTITWTNPASIGYGTALGTNQNAASASVAGTYVYNPTNETVLSVGTNTLHVSFTPTDTNYAATNLSATLVVTPAVLVITANSTNKVYNTTLVFSGGEYTSSGLVNGNTVTNVTLASAGASPAAPVGVYAITATNALGIGLTNYSIIYSNGQLTVEPGIYTIAWTNPASITYGMVLGTNQNAAGASVAGSYNYNPTNGAVPPAGTNTLHVTFTPNDTNYAATNLSATLVVTPAALVITANSTNKLYNTTLVFSGGEYTSSGLVNGNVVTNVTLASAGASPAAPVGVYAVTATNALGSGLTNYSIVYSNGQLTVGQGAYTIAWTNPANITYGTALGTNQNAASASVAGNYNYNPTNGAVLSVGTNTLHVTFTPGDTNYAATNLSATLVVTPAALVITANSTNKLYNTALAFGGGEFTSSGLVNGNVVTNVTLTSDGALPAAPVGLYAITATNALGSGLTNYSIVYSNGQLTVESGIYSIEWTNPASIGYGTALGTNQNAASASVAGTYVYNPTNGAVLSVGTNTLQVTFTPTDTNYAATNLSATLVVTPAAVSLLLTSSSQTNGYHGSVTFTVTNLPSGAGSNVVFQANGVSFSTNNVINGGVTSLNITNLPRGSTNIILATYNGDGSYLSASTNLIQSVTNHPPVVTNQLMVARSLKMTWKTNLSYLVTNGMDLDGDTLTLIAPAENQIYTSTNGVAVTNNGVFLLYNYTTNSPDVNDRIYYTIGDGYGGTNSGYVDVIVNPFVLTGQPLVLTNPATPTLKLYGIKGFSYSVERSTNITFSPVSVLWQTNLMQNGPFIYTDPAPPQPQAFYRLSSP